MTPAPAFDEAALAALIGTEFPAGSYRIDPVVSQMLSNAVLAEPGPQPHPIYAFVAAQTGIGLDVEGLLGLFGSTGADGPMLGECELEMFEPFKAGVEYQVTGQITGAVRKKGRALGVFDLVSFALEIRDPAGRPVSTCRETFVLPRREVVP